MDKKVGRNDPCPCGSGKKYKQCCLKSTGGRKKIKAKIISSGMTNGSGAPKVAAPDLLERTFGDAIRSIREEEKSAAPEAAADAEEKNQDEQSS